MVGDVQRLHKWTPLTLGNMLVFYLTVALYWHSFLTLHLHDIFGILARHPRNLERMYNLVFAKNKNQWRLINLTTIALTLPHPCLTLQGKVRVNFSSLSSLLSLALSLSSLSPTLFLSISITLSSLLLSTAFSFSPAFSLSLVGKIPFCLWLKIPHVNIDK